MKSHSSIFNSDTLQIEKRIPAGAAFALFLVVIANTWAYIAEKNGKLYTSIPRQMIDNSIRQLENSNKMWMLGNSTLAAGLDKDMLDINTINDSAIIELGSATLDTTIRLSEVALQNEGVKPEKILLFFTKDDINQNGARAKASKSYHQAIGSTSLYEYVATLFPVYSTRFAITDIIKNTIASIAVTKNAQAVSLPGNINDRHQKYKDLSADVDTTYLLNLGKDYKPIDIDLSRLGQLANIYQTEVYLVAPPVASAIAEWQRRYSPEYQWEDIMQRIKNDALSAGIKVLDYTDLLDSTTEYFKDVYHLNSNGSKVFTMHLLTDINEDT